MLNVKCLKNVMVAATAVMIFAGGTWAGPASAERAKTKGASESSSSAGAAGLFGSIPAKSMFCVRVNDLDGTIAAINEYLKGVASESFDANEAVTGVLDMMLGIEELPGVNGKRDLAIFAVNAPAENPQPSMMGNIFIGALIPVGDYGQFVSQNPNCSRPDDQGISTVTVDSRPVSLVTNFERFAILCPAEARQKLIAVRKMLEQKKESLAAVLDDDEQKQAAGASVWVYLNVKEIAGFLRPVFMGGLEQMRVQFQKMKESRQGPPMMVDPSAIFNFYGDIFQLVIDGTDHVTIALTPSPKVCNVAFGLKPIPGTQMAAIVGRPVGGGFGNALGYLDDGAMMNLACKIDHESLKAGYMKLIDMVGKMAPEAIPAADLERFRKLATDAVGAMGDSIAFSVKLAPEGSPVFSGQYIIQIRDQQAFDRVINEKLTMMQEGTLARLYKGIGMELDFKVERGTETYKDLKINSAKMAFRMGDDKSPQSVMIRKMYGETLDYCWAFVEGYCVCSIGARADQTIHELIDQVKAGGPKEIGSETKAALAAIPDSQRAEAVGTINYVRVLNVAMSALPLLEDANQPKVQTPTKSSIAFAGRTTAAGKLDVQIALPKEHLLEIKSAFKSFVPQMKKQQELQMQKQKEPS